MLNLLHFFYLKKGEVPNIIWIIGMLHALAFAFIDMTFPLYVTELGGSAVIVGVAVATFGIMKLIFSSFGGYVSDFIGKKKILNLSLLLFIISGFIYYFSDSYSYLLLGKFFQGIAGGTFWVSITSLIEINAKDLKASAIGLFQSVASLITLITILASGFIITYFPIRITMMIFLLIFILNFIISSKFLKEDEVPKTKSTKIVFAEDFKNFFINRQGYILSFSLFAIGFFSGFGNAFIPIYALKLHLNYIEMSILEISTLVGFVFIPFFSGIFSDKISRKIPIIFGNLLASIILMLLFFFTNKFIIIFLFFILSMAIIIPYPSIIGIINQGLPDNQTGRFNGITISIKMFGFIIASILGGFLFMTLGFLYSFIVMSILFLIATIMSLKLNCN